MNIENPKPREQWCTDMERQTTEWIEQGSNVLLMCDANSPLNDAGFAKFVAKSKLYDLIGSKHGMGSPPTYLRGSKTIDYLLGTYDIAIASTESGYLKFKNGIHSDH
jgi:hypothetical protein